MYTITDKENRRVRAHSAHKNTQHKRLLQCASLLYALDTPASQEWCAGGGPNSSSSSSSSSSGSSSGSNSNSSSVPWVYVDSGTSRQDPTHLVTHRVVMPLTTLAHTMIAHLSIQQQQQQQGEAITAAAEAEGQAAAAAAVAAAAGAAGAAARLSTQQLQGGANGAAGAAAHSYLSLDDGRRSSSSKSGGRSSRGGSGAVEREGRLALQEYRRLLCELDEVVGHELDAALQVCVCVYACG